MAWNKSDRIVGDAATTLLQVLDGFYLFKDLKFVQNKQSGSGVDCFVLFSNGVKFIADNCHFLNEQGQSGGRLC